MDEVIFSLWNMFKKMNENSYKIIYIMLQVSQLNIKGSGHILCLLRPSLLKSRGKTLSNTNSKSTANMFMETTGFSQKFSLDDFLVIDKLSSLQSPVTRSLSCFEVAKSSLCGELKFDFLYWVTCVRFTTFPQGYFRIAMKIEGDCFNPFSDGIGHSRLVKRHLLISFTNCVVGKMD